MRQTVCFHVRQQLALSLLGHRLLVCVVAVVPSGGSVYCQRLPGRRCGQGDVFGVFFVQQRWRQRVEHAFFGFVGSFAGGEHFPGFGDHHRQISMVEFEELVSDYGHSEN